MQSFSDMPIGLFFGTGDLLVASDDYFWLRDQLMQKNNCAFFKEYDLGHIGLVIPKDRQIYMDMLALLSMHIEDTSKLRLPGSESSFMEAIEKINQNKT